MKKGFVVDIEDAVRENENFRKVVYTGGHSQLVLMTLKPGEEIGEEVHPDTDQFFRFEQGSGKVVIDGNEYAVEEDFAAVVPAGAKHNVINTGEENLKLYTIYSPAEHLDKVIHATKEAAVADIADHFDGKTTE
jgi:mannose-6-phosphate isomerase-like protein (cupin superfamily)